MTIQTRFQNQHKRKKPSTIFAILFINALLLIIAACNKTSSVTPIKTSSLEAQKPAPSHNLKADLPAGFPIPDPDEYNACMEQGGRWEILGFSGPGCNLPTTDGGKSCNDGDDCESVCLANDEELIKILSSGLPIFDVERMEEINAQGDEISGICSPWQKVYSCYISVEDGKYGIGCVD